MIGKNASGDIGAPPTRGRAIWRWLGRIAILLLVLVVALGVFIGYRLWGPVVPGGELAGLSEDNTQGPADARVRIVEFSDFGCPACRRWHRSGIRQQIMAMFGDDVSFTYRHFPVISEYGVDAAIAAQCAGRQGAFWGYHDYLFEQAAGFTEQELAGYAEQLGLDRRAFEECTRSEDIREYVDRDQRSALREGALGTPAFFVNGRLVYDPTLDELRSLIEQLL